MSTYTGPVVFAGGVHYPIDKDGEANTERPLRMTPDGSWRDAQEGEPLHNDANQGEDVELEIGGED